MNIVKRPIIQKLIPLGLGVLNYFLLFSTSADIYDIDTLELLVSFVICFLFFARAFKPYLKCESNLFILYCGLLQHENIIYTKNILKVEIWIDHESYWHFRFIQKDGTPVVLSMLFPGQSVAGKVTDLLKKYEVDIQFI